MNSEDKKTIWHEAIETHKRTVVILNAQLEPKQKDTAKTQKSDCRDKSLVVKSVMDSIDNQMGDLRKEKRLWRGLRDDLDNDFTKMNDLFFDLLRDEPKRPSSI